MEQRPLTQVQRGSHSSRQPHMGGRPLTVAQQGSSSSSTSRRVLCRFPTLARQASSRGSNHQQQYHPLALAQQGSSGSRSLMALCHSPASQHTANPAQQRSGRRSHLYKQQGCPAEQGSSGGSRQQSARCHQTTQRGSYSCSSRHTWWHPLTQRQWWTGRSSRPAFAVFSRQVACSFAAALPVLVVYNRCLSFHLCCL